MEDGLDNAHSHSIATTTRTLFGLLLNVFNAVFVEGNVFGIIDGIARRIGWIATMHSETLDTIMNEECVQRHIVKY